ncbi:hypothetical protein [Trinickia mobilis]|uniref:hypothetical protein n=1 Tax=Trinickia mobilis TaxID=2816356 RepID=UPI001A8E3783|nr:hypothetical protein [Trinickia mobilis]
MKYLTLKIALTCGTVAAICLTGAAFAAGSGMGNGGSGGGNAHSAATAGMTYHGDPVTSPLDTMPGKMENEMGKSQGSAHSMSPDDAVDPAKNGQ